MTAPPNAILLQRRLSGPLPATVLPDDLAFASFDPVRDPPAVHVLLRRAYASGGGEIADFDIWWPGLRSDPEFDPGLVFLVSDGAGFAGVAQCWTSGFIKDLAVRADLRGQGIGTALLARCFSAFVARGLDTVSLKVRGDNPAAERLYRRLGMIEA